MKWYFLCPLILQKLMWVPVRLMFTVFSRFEVRGLENLKGVHDNVIFASNHSSELDPLLIPAALPFWSKFSPVFYAVREKTFYENSGWRKHLFGGLFIKMWGGYPVYIGMHDYEKSLSHHVCLLEEGGTLCVFPEGMKSLDGALQPAKGGIAYLMERTNRPSVPVAITGAFSTKLKTFFTLKDKITVTFGLPVYLAEIRSNPDQSLSGVHNIYKRDAQYVMKKIGELMKE